MCRKKIATVVSRGGRADPEAPLDDASTRYKVTVSMEEEEVWKTKTSASTNAEIHHADAARIYGLGVPSAGTSVMSPDPTALVRQELLACSAPASTPSAAPATPASTAGFRAAGRLTVSYVFFHFVCGQEKQRPRPKQRLQTFLLSQKWLWLARLWLRRLLQYVGSSC